MSEILDEADLLFGRLFPRILLHQSEKLRTFRGAVELRVSTDPPRVWRLLGGAPPWLKSGPVEGRAPDVVLTLSPRLVKRIVRGGEPLDFDRALADGDLVVKGSLPELAELEIDPAKLLPRLAAEPATPMKRRVAPVKPLKKK